MSTEGPSTPSLEAIDRAISGGIWAESRAMEHLVALCDRFGGRFAGSGDERAAGDYLLDQLRALGLADVHAEAFRYLGWRRGPASVAMLLPREQPLDAIALPGGPPCDLSARVVAVGDGEEDDYARVAEGLRGAIALCNAESASTGKPASHRRAKYLRAARARAAAFLYVSQNPGMLAVTGGLASAAAAPIPGFGLSYETGLRIARLLGDGEVTLRLRGEHELPEVTSRNIVAELPGSESQEGLVLVGAHYDGHDVAQAAGDNGSGTVALLEAARVLAPFARRLRRMVRFVWFAAEESGLLGSWWYARSHGNEAGRLGVVLNLDSVVAGPPGGQQIHCGNSHALEERFAELAARLGLDVRVDGHLSPASDHFPFLTLGIPVATLGATTGRTGLVGRGWGHTIADTVDKVEPAALQLAALISARLVLHLAAAPSLPPRLSPEQTQALLEETRTDANAERGLKLALRAADAL